MNDDVKQFNGFKNPRQNWSKLPHQLIEALPVFSSKAELSVVLYILRHTWGYSDDKKRITLDEFENGRKRRDGTRIDSGVGMLRQAIIAGLRQAEEHGFIEVETDAGDSARIKKYYRLTTRQRYENHTSEVWKSHPGSMEITPRTEKDTSERNSGKKKDSAPATQDAAAKSVSSSTASKARSNPLFDEVAAQFFGAKAEDKPAVKAVGGRVGKLVAFLSTRTDVTPDAVKRFVVWYRQQHSGLSLPNNPASLMPHWQAFEALSPSPVSSNSNGKRKAYYQRAWVAAERLSPDGTLDGTLRPGWMLVEIAADGTYDGVVLHAGEKVYDDGTMPLAWQGLE